MIILQLSWHPQKEGWLGFGTEDGRVGVLDVSLSGNEIVSGSKDSEMILESMHFNKIDLSQS